MKSSTDKKDVWSAPFVVIPLLALLAFLWSNRTDDPIWSPFFIGAIEIIATIGVFWSIFEIVCSRPRQAMSLLAGIVLMSAGTYFSSSIILQNRFTEFKQIVERQRASLKNTNADSGSDSVDNVGKPLRMIVSLGNWHGNSSENGEFEYVVFDETDQVALHPETLKEFLPYPGSHFSAVATEGKKAVAKVGNHFYRITETK